MEEKERIRKRVLENIEKSRKGREASRMGKKEPDYSEHKFTSKNFVKWEEQAMLKKREKALAKEGKTLTDKDRREIRKEAKTEAWKNMRSFNKWAPDEREIAARREVARKKGLPEPTEKPTKDKTKSTEVKISHSDPKKDRGYVTGTKGRRPSGKYVAVREPRSSAAEKRGYALPARNKANETREVKIHGDKLRGVTAAQPEWSKEAAKRGDRVPRTGGKQQYYVQRGYATHGNRKNAEGVREAKARDEKAKNVGVSTVRGTRADVPDKAKTGPKTPAKTPEKAPAKTPAKTPEKAPAKTPAKAPEKTPAKTPEKSAPAPKVSHSRGRKR